MADTSELLKAIQEIKEAQDNLAASLKEELIEVHAMLNLIYDQTRLHLQVSQKYPREEFDAKTAEALETYRKHHREILSQRWK